MERFGDLNFKGGGTEKYTLLHFIFRNIFDLNNGHQWQRLEILKNS